MSILDAMKNRRSIRSYKDTPVEDEKIESILEAARLSPSAKNAQDWKFVVVEDLRTREEITEATGQRFVGEAPVIIVACGTNPGELMKCGQPRYTVDLSIATSYMILEAYEQGLGTCWLGSFDEERVKEILGIPEGVRVVAMTPLGYSDESPEAKPRKQIEEIVSYDKY